MQYECKEVKSNERISINPASNLRAFFSSTLGIWRNRSVERGIGQGPFIGRIPAGIPSCLPGGRLPSPLAAHGFGHPLDQDVTYRVEFCFQPRKDSPHAISSGLTSFRSSLHLRVFLDFEAEFISLPARNIHCYYYYYIRWICSE